MEPTNILPIVAVLSLVAVEYGGWDGIWSVSLEQLLLLRDGVFNVDG